MRDLNESHLTQNPTTKLKIVLNAAVIIVKDHLLSINNMLWDINCTLYCIAILCKELNNDISETSKKWSVNMTNSIEKIRKLIAHVNVVI